MKPWSVALSVSALALGSVVLFARQEPGDEMEAMPMVKPTEQHKLLERQVGTWDATVSMMGMPDSKAVYTATLDHGGLWLIGDFRGEFMGPFSGHEVKGYSTTKKKYVSTWVDSMINNIMAFEGDYDPKTQTLAMWTEFDPSTGEPSRSRHDTKFVDADTFTFTMNNPGPDGKLAPVMTITYKRRK